MEGDPEAHSSALTDALSTPGQLAAPDRSNDSFQSNSAANDGSGDHFLAQLLTHEPVREQPSKVAYQSCPVPDNKAKAEESSARDNSTNLGISQLEEKKRAGTVETGWTDNAKIQNGNTQPEPLPMSSPAASSTLSEKQPTPIVTNVSQVVESDDRSARETQVHNDESGYTESSKRPESLPTGHLTYPNGVSMFPSLSAPEQEDLSREAFDQAEETIIADGEETRSVADESDAGYDSDGFSSASTSAESMIRDYLYENGRRYHRFREGIYNFPNDDVEQEREDMKHAMVKLLCGQKLHFSPIGDNPQEILDIGTGTGIWPIEMGDLFPSAHILGIDLSPIQPDWLPPNVRFLVDDAESPWLHPRNHFDYIHSRHTVMAIRDWMRLFRRALEHLKPGGWIELQEIHHCPRSALMDADVPTDHPVAQFWSNVTDGLTALGVDFNASSGGKLANMMQQAGFTNVTERIFHVPIGTWPKNKVLKTVGLYWRTILLDGLQAIALGPLTRGLQWNREQVELFLMNVRQAYYDNAARMYMPLHIIYAQKPLHDY